MVVHDHPLRMLTVWVVVLAALALCALGFKVTYNQLAELPSSTLSQQAYDTMASAFPAGALGPTQVFVTSDTEGPAGPGVGHRPRDPPGLDHGGVGRLPGPLHRRPRARRCSRCCSIRIRTASPAINDVAGPLRSAGQRLGARRLGGRRGDHLPAGGRPGRPPPRHGAGLPAGLGHRGRDPGPPAPGAHRPALPTGRRGAHLRGHPRRHHPGVPQRVRRSSGLDFSIPIVVYLFVMAIGTDYNILIASRLREEFAAGGAATRGGPAWPSTSGARRSVLPRSSWPGRSPR